jgi:CO dehydrogenase/acetyl-CoA synthase alpha subunit
MTISDAALLDGFAPAVLADDLKITGVYCADLLSWAMGRAPGGCAWCTVMGNINAVAVAILADVAAIVLCEGAALDNDAKLKATQQGINIITTTLPAFEAGLVIHGALEEQ